MTATRINQASRFPTQVVNASILRLNFSSDCNAGPPPCRFPLTPCVFGCGTLRSGLSGPAGGKIERTISAALGPVNWKIEKLTPPQRLARSRQVRRGEFQFRRFHLCLLMWHRTRDACCARVVKDRSPLSGRGAGNAGRWPRPWPACRKESRRQSPQVQPRHPGIPCAMALRLTSRSPQGPAFLPLYPRDAKHHRVATARVPRVAQASAPGSQDHTT